jgi:hypothetical protein
MACKKRFLISSALPVLALILVGPVWAVPIVTYNEPPDGVNFVLTIFEAAFATQNPAVPPQTKGFWLVNVTQLSEVRTAAGMNDTVAISGNARHLRGPVDDPHGAGSTFTFGLDVFGPVDQAMPFAHGTHRDEFSATLDSTFDATGRKITGYTFTLTGLHVPAPVPEPVPEPATLLLFGTTMAGLGLGARWRRRRQK